MKLLKQRRGRRTLWLPPEGTHFITVDLDILSRTRLSALVAALGDKVVVLHEGRRDHRYAASVELGNSWDLDVNQEIRRLVRLVRALPRSAQRLWKGAESRNFNIGVQAALTPHAHVLGISRTTVAAIAGVQAGMAVTTYAPESRPIPEPSSVKSGKGRRTSA